MKIVRSPLLSRARLPQWQPFDVVNDLTIRTLRAGGMVSRLLSRYGIGDLSQAHPYTISKALVDFVSRTAIHSNPHVHPSGSTANLTVLPSGKTWADFNAKFAAVIPGGGSQAEADTQFWAGKNSLQIFQQLYGTIQDDGTLAQNGFLQEYGPGQWRIRSLDTYRSVWCTYSNRTLEVLFAVTGMFSGTNHTMGHDQGIVMLPDVGWVVADPTYNETHQTTDGKALTVPELHDLSIANATAGIVAIKQVPGPDHDPKAWSPTLLTNDTTYFGTGVHPVGMIVVGRSGVMAFTPALPTEPTFGQATWPKAAMADVFAPYGLAAVPDGAGGVRLIVNAPYLREPPLQRRRVEAGTWQPWPLRGDRQPADAGVIEYRVDPAVARVSGCAVDWAAASAL